MVYFLIALFLLVALWILIRCLYIPYPEPHTLYFGKPGSGKTMFLTRIALKFKDKHTVLSNYAIADPKVYKIKKSDFGHFALPDGSIVLFDEASLSGFDNRDFKNNFRDEKNLDFFKKIRHHKAVMVWSNQGYNELDVKIRTLTNAIYLVKKLPFFSVALRIYFDTGPKRDTKTIEDQYTYASIVRMMFDPRCIQFLLRSKYGRYYNSWEREKLPPLRLRPWTSLPSQAEPAEDHCVS